MVYNAMKMFMEINPQLFDECSHEYNERQNGAEQREKTRQDRWSKLAELAKDRRNGVPAPSVHLPATEALGQVDEVDTFSEENESRLNALKIQDDPTSTKERRKLRELSQSPVSYAQLRSSS